jgi:aspartyl-tRNA(Asn)/glutamyl-tRNA(Gln) amidotransferase subunit B
MRSKEEANDYRYFPDPDLLPVVLDDAYLAAVKATLPELPDVKRDRFIEQYGLSSVDAGILTMSKALADYFEKAAEISGAAKQAANWVMGEVSALLNKNDMDIADCPVTADMLAGMIKRIEDNTISGKIAKEVFEAMWAGDGDADTVIDKKGLKQITDTSAIEALVDEVLAKNPSQVEEYKAGKEQLMGFFVGQIMQASRGKANPGQVNQLLKKKLGS